jgi:hypothetical protein
MCYYNGMAGSEEYERITHLQATMTQVRML